jgi:hypothetical protein
MRDSKRELGKIDYVRSGKEDHGILTCSIGIDFNGDSHQGFGGLCLDTDLIKSFKKDLCKTFGVKKIEDLVGKECFALRCFGFLNDNIEGLETLDGKKFTISTWRKKHFTNASNPLEQRFKHLVSEINHARRQIKEAEQDLAQLDSEYTNWG